MIKLCAALGLLFVICIENTTAQYSTAYQSLSYSHSIISAGMGEQGAAMKNPSDAMQYNPANLIYTENASVSFFRNPWMIMNDRAPLTSKTVSMRFANGSAAGLEYTEFVVGYDPLPFFDWASNYLPIRFRPYQQSIAGAFALPLGTEWAAGVHLRYAWASQSSKALSNDLLFGAGVSYMPEALGKRATVGLSFMNFGAAADNSQPVIGSVSQTDPLPAQINLAAEGSILTEPFFDVTVALGFTKPLGTREETPNYLTMPRDDRAATPNYSSESSYKALLSDWTDFPSDVTSHVGLGYKWKPLPLGGGIAFFQEMYLGYFTGGVSSAYTSFFTHGVQAGIEAFGVKASAGYAGRWHNNGRPMMLWSFPWETFQFTLSADWDAARGLGHQMPAQDLLQRIIVSGGYSYCAPVGHEIGAAFYGLDGNFSPRSLWSIESDFYVSDNSAVIASSGYAHMGRTSNAYIDYIYDSNNPPGQSGIETFALESGFRYHPFPTFHQIFVQASLGIMWLNPGSQYAIPRYMYKPFDDLVVGWTIPIRGTGVIVMPKAGFKTVFMEIAPGNAGIGGCSQFEFGVNAGYAL